MRPAPIYYLRVKENMSVAMRFKSEGFFCHLQHPTQGKMFQYTLKGFYHNNTIY